MRRFFYEAPAEIMQNYTTNEACNGKLNYPKQSVQANLYSNIRLDYFAKIYKIFCSISSSVESS